MHYLYRYVCILNVFFYICIWTIVCNKKFIIILCIDSRSQRDHDGQWSRINTSQLHFAECSGETNK